jgi:hypothetical protein
LPFGVFHRRLQHSHPTFTPPFNKGTVIGLWSGVLFGGIGIIMWSVTYQQKKGGFWSAAQ